MNQAGRTSSHELEEDIRRTRGEMDETIDRLSERLTPGHILDSVLDSFKSKGNSTVDGGRARRALKSSGYRAGRSVREAVQDYPGPIALCTAGALWWMYEAATENGESYEYRPRRASVDFRSRASAPWEDNYDWRRSSFGAEEDWEREASRRLQELESSSSDNQEPSEQIRGAASHLIILSGLDAEEIRNRAEYGWSPSSPTRDVLIGCHKVRESGSHESLRDKAATSWQSIKETLRDTKKSTKQKLQSIGESISEYAEQAAEYLPGGDGRTSQFARRAYDRGAEFGHYARERGRMAGRRVSSSLESGRQSIVSSAERHPLAAAGACFGLGLAAGLLIPSTEYEDELMGEASDELEEGAAAKAREAGRRGREVISRTARAAAEEAERQGLSPDELRRPVNDAASSLARGVKQGREAAEAKGRELRDKAAAVGETARRTAEEEARRQSNSMRRSE